MRRVPLLDRILLLVLLPLWALCLGLSVQTILRGDHIAHVTVLPPENDDSYPTLAGYRPYAARGRELLAGDRLLRVGDTDLRGASPVDFQIEVLAGTRGGEAVPVRFERDGVVRESLLPVGPYAHVIWPWLPIGLACALVAVIVRLRARPTALIRWGFAALMCVAFLSVSHFGGSRRLALGSYGLSTLTFCATPVLLLYALMRFPVGEAPASAWARFGPWLFAPVGLLGSSAIYGIPFAIRPEVGYPLTFVCIAPFLALCLWIVTRNYRRADPIGRRQLKWFFFGFYVAAIPIALGAVLPALDPRLIDVSIASLSAASIIPLALLVSITRYNLFDVDRLLSATATYNVVIALLAGLGIALVPRIAEAGASALGIDPTMGRVMLSLALAAVVVPTERRLRPQVERLFFAERFATDEGIAALLRELPDARDPTALTVLLGERLNELLRPEACVVYARDEAGRAYLPVYVEGAAVPPAFDAESTLAGVLRKRGRGGALVAAGDDLDPFDRAALETLGAEVVLPIHRGDLLFAFLCLGPRRSGDVYTPTDVRLLGAVAARASGELERFEQAALLRQAHAMQESLRRYVPGAVAEELDAGGELHSGEREVTILFVDLRGYTAFSEARAAEEIFSTVNRYTEAVSEIVRARGGSVVEFNGDGMMTVFGAPRPLPEKERAALAAAREIVSSVPALAPEGAAPLGVGVGIATGEAFVGSVRSADRLIWTAIGNTTNLAARLQALTRDLGASIVIDDATRRAARGDAADFTSHGDTRIRGRSGPVAVHGLPLAKGWTGTDGSRR